MAIKILMVDDDHDDQYLYRDLFLSMNQDIDFECTDNADDFFKRFPLDYQCESYPDLIILDMNLPKHNGLEIYLHIRQIAKMERVPVIILTTSSSPMDIEDSRRLGLHSYFIKPMDYTETKALVDAIYNYWFKFNALVTQ